METPKLSFDCPRSMLDGLVARYGESHRRYHTWEHVLACFSARDLVTDVALPEVDLALLFHDAIYEPLSSDNEAKSAALLVEQGRFASVDEDVLQRAHALVLATKHAVASEHDSSSARIVLDADLSILGAERATFDRYEQDVREEFAMVDDAMFRAGRRRVLESFLARPTIYSTDRGRNLWEARARENLERSLAALHE